MAGGTKELFNQTLKTTLGSTDRFAVGIPGQEGADNILITNLLKFFFKFGQSVNVNSGNNTITFGSAYPSGVADYVVFIRTTNGSGYSITSQTNTGFDVEFLDSDTIDYLCIKI